MDTERGSEIRQWRLLHDLTQEELGELVGVDQSQISQWEAGRIGRGWSNYWRLVVVNNLTPDHLPIVPTERGDR